MQELAPTRTDPVSILANCGHTQLMQTAAKHTSVRDHCGQLIQQNAAAIGESLNALPEATPVRTGHLYGQVDKEVQWGGACAPS